MPFVSDIVGPRRPVGRWPIPAPGVMRRTSTIDTIPDGPAHQNTELRARDVRFGPSGAAGVIGDVVVRARLTERVIEAMVGDDDRLTELCGVRVGPGFRAKASSVFGSDVGPPTLLDLLLDDWVGASLVTGYGFRAGLGGGRLHPAQSADAVRTRTGGT